MRTFEHFPETSTCPMCGTNDDRECMLVPIDGTEVELNAEAVPVHTDCLQDSLWYYRDMGIIAAIGKDYQGGNGETP